MICCSFMINIVQLWGIVLLPFRPLYRRYMRFSQRLFGSLMLVVTYILAPLQINLSGCHQELQADTFAPIMANHQIYTDWWYVWLFGWFRNAHGELKIILKDSLKHVPVMGIRWK